MVIALTLTGVSFGAGGTGGVDEGEGVGGAGEAVIDVMFLVVEGILEGVGVGAGHGEVGDGCAA